MMKESRELLKQLKLIFATIIRFCKAQENLYTTAMHEKHVEERLQQSIRRQELDVRSWFCIVWSGLLAFHLSMIDVQTSWGIQEENVYSKRSDRDTFGAESKILRQIEEVADEFSNQFLGLRDIVKQNSMRYEPACAKFDVILVRVSYSAYVILSVDYKVCHSLCPASISTSSIS